MLSARLVIALIDVIRNRNRFWGLMLLMLGGSFTVQAASYTWYFENEYQTWTGKIKETIKTELIDYSGYLTTVTEDVVDSIEGNSCHFIYSGGYAGLANTVFRTAFVSSGSLNDMILHEPFHSLLTRDNNQSFVYPRIFSSGSMPECFFRNTSRNVKDSGWVISQALEYDPDLQTDPLVIHFSGEGIETRFWLRNILKHQGEHKALVIIPGLINNATPVDVTVQNNPDVPVYSINIKPTVSQSARLKLPEQIVFQVDASDSGRYVVFAVTVKLAGQTLKMIREEYSDQLLHIVSLSGGDESEPSLQPPQPPQPPRQPSQKVRSSQELQFQQREETLQVPVEHERLEAGRREAAGRLEARIRAAAGRLEARQREQTEQRLQKIHQLTDQLEQGLLSLSGLRTLLNHLVLLPSRERENPLIRLRPLLQQRLMGLLISGQEQEQEQGWQELISLLRRLDLQQENDLLHLYQVRQTDLQRQVESYIAELEQRRLTQSELQALMDRLRQLSHRVRQQQLNRLLQARHLRLMDLLGSIPLRQMNIPPPSVGRQLFQLGQLGLMDRFYQEVREYLRLLEQNRQETLRQIDLLEAGGQLSLNELQDLLNRTTQLEPQEQRIQRVRLVRLIPAAQARELFQRLQLIAPMRFIRSARG